jgi:single stranded DNA-binding protein
MADYNHFGLSGRLTRDAERKTLPTGTNLVTFDIANNTGYGQYEKTLYCTVNLWGKSGENLIKYLTKGKHVIVDGSLEMQRWVSKQDGSQQKKLVLNSNNVTLLGGGQKVEEPTQTYEGEATPYNDSEDIAF